MKKLVFALFAIFTLVVGIVITSVKHFSHSPPAQNFIIAEDEVAPMNIYAIAVNANLPAEEGCVSKEEVINMISSQHVLTDVPPRPTREGCGQKHDVYINELQTTHNLLVSNPYSDINNGTTYAGLTRNGQGCHILKHPLTTKVVASAHHYTRLFEA